MFCIVIKYFLFSFSFSFSFHVLIEEGRTNVQWCNSCAISKTDVVELAKSCLMNCIRCQIMVTDTSGVRAGGGGGSGVKTLFSLFFKRTAFFHTEIAEIALMFFCAIQLAYKILKNFHCDAIIGLLIVKLCLCVALDNCRNSETILVFKAKSFLRTVTVSEAGVFCFPDTPIMCLRVSHDIDAVIWVENT